MSPKAKQPERAAASLRQMIGDAGYPEATAQLRAETGDPAPAQRLVSTANPLTERNTIHVYCTLPMVRSTLALLAHQPAEAVRLLEPARPYQLRDFEVLYLRAQAETAAGQLDAAARAKLMHNKHKNVQLSFGQILTKYSSRVVEHTQLNGRACLLIDSIPLETIADAPKRHLRIWLDPEKNEFLRIDFDLLADEDDLLRGSSGSMSFTYIDGVLLDTVHHLDFTVPAKDKKKSAARVVSDQTFSNYRKFVSTTRILPDEEVRSPQ